MGGIINRADNKVQCESQYSSLPKTFYQSFFTNRRRTSEVTNRFVGCATHFSSNGYRGCRLKKCLAYAETFDGQLRIRAPHYRTRLITATNSLNRRDTRLEWPGRGLDPESIRGAGDIHFR